MSTTKLACPGTVDFTDLIAQSSDLSVDYRKEIEDILGKLWTAAMISKSVVERMNSAKETTCGNLKLMSLARR